MTSRKLLKNLLVVGLGLLLFIVLGCVSGKKALAFATNNPIGQNAPQTDSADIIGGPTTVQPWFAVGEGAYDGTFSYAKIYLPNGYGGTLTVHNGNGVCPLDVGSPQVNYRIKYMDQTETLKGSQSAPKDNSGGCGNITFNITGGSDQSKKVGHTGYHVYYFEADITGPGIGDNEKNFRLSISTNSGGPQSFIGVSRPATAYAKPWFGIYMRDAPQRGGTNWNYEVQFAPWCNEASNPQRQIHIHDIDWQVYAQPNLEANIDKDNRADGTFNWGLAPPGYNSGINATTSKKVANNNVSNDWPVGNNTNTDLTINYDNSFRYLMEFRDINWHNTIQVSLPFDQFDAKQSVGTACENSIVSCNVLNPPDGATIPPGQTTNVTVQGNDPTGDWNGDGYTIKRLANADGEGYGPPVSGNPATVQVHPPPGYSGSITYHFGIYKNGNYTNYSCPVTYNVSSSPGNLSVSCTTSRAPPMSSTATYTSVVTPNPGYWTYKTPDANSNPFQYPHIWYSQPPDNSSDIRNSTPKPVPGQDYGVNPGIGGLIIWYYWVGQIQVNHPATIVPFYIHFVGSDGSVNDTGVYKAGVNSPYPFPSTFGDFSFLRPHNTYTATLYAQTSGNLGTNQGGPYGNPWTQIGSPQYLPQCLQAHLTGSFAVCGGGTNPTVEIGQPTSIQYTLNIENKTNIAFPTSIGYNVLLQPSSGMTVTSANPFPAALSPPGPGNDVVVASYTVVLSNSGSYSVAFRYGGTILTTLGPDGWDGTCGPEQVTAVAKPYLQAWNGSVSAGGGFRSPGQNDTGTCGTAADTPYIYPYGTGDQNSGGIEAFGKQAANRGSRTDFGALALGYIIGAPGGGGAGNDTGFYSGDGAAGDRMVYSNTLGGFFSSNMGGYFNDNSATASSGQCASDFYSNTQVSPMTTTGNLSSDLNDCINNHGGRCQYSYDNVFSNLTDGDVTIPDGVQMTIYVNHSITINGNIRYGNFDATQQNHVPYFALIVKGNITVTGSARQLDGLYIAQPVKGVNNTGIFATCNDICNTQLVVNGAVIAQEVDLLRNHGTLSGNTDPQITGNPAEIFNFVPSMIIGQPAFGAKVGTPQGVFDLPPVF